MCITARTPHEPRRLRESGGSSKAWAIGSELCGTLCHDCSLSGWSLTYSIYFLLFVTLKAEIAAHSLIILVFSILKILLLDLIIIIGKALSSIGCLHWNIDLWNIRILLTSIFSELNLFSSLICCFNLFLLYFSISFWGFDL